MIVNKSCEMKQLQNLVLNIVKLMNHVNLMFVNNSVKMIIFKKQHLIDKQNKLKLMMNNLEPIALKQIVKEFTFTLIMHHKSSHIINLEYRSC